MRPDPRLERREVQDLGRFGKMDQFQFVRLGLGGVMALLAFGFGALTVDTIRMIVRGEWSPTAAGAGLVEDLDRLRTVSSA